MELAKQICASLQGYKNCIKNDNVLWLGTHKNVVEKLVEAYMPSGDGFDNGTHIDFDASTESKLVFYTSFHHMNSAGYYDGWTEHKVTVSATFNGFDVKVSGKNKNDIKDYIAECFHNDLAQDVPMENIRTFYNDAEANNNVPV